ncbi:unnamed protein product [Lactuca saligna]|uniref:Glutamate N-acetyltransferase n=1 Tax=Lactuca saligna TaxID=75948 RepID=A0AA35VIN0_LACSI|nr:unnamed protein product [Lactuca saligna]
MPFPIYFIAVSGAVAITSDIVSKIVAVEFEVGGSRIRIRGMAKGSRMIHQNMGTLLGVAVNRSFNHIIVDGDTSTNDTIIALASGLSGSKRISSLHSSEGNQLQMCLDAVMQVLVKSIAWDGEGATCLIEVFRPGQS